MSQIAIRAAFEKRLNDWAKAQSPPIPVAFENVAFIPPASLYVRAFLLSGETQNPSLGGSHQRRIGLFQVSVVAPVNGGARPAETVAEALEALFPRGLTVGPAQVDTTPSIAPALSDGERYTVPVSIRYRADIFA